MVQAEPTPRVGGRPSESPTVYLRDFGEVLKRLREQSTATQASSAKRVGVSRATFTQWETGRHLPTTERVRQLDEFLGADGELVAIAGRVRSPQRLRTVDTLETAASNPATRSLLQVFSDVRTALLGQLCFDDGRPTGWRHNLVASDADPTVVSTAYGLKTLALLGGPCDGTAALVDVVLRKAVRDGDRIVGWGARSQVTARIESTAIVLDALLLLGAPIGVDEVLRVLGGLLDETARQRPFILTTALEPVLRVAPDSSLAAELIELLLACRRDFGGVPLWPEKLVPARDQPLLDPSVVHTARAVTALRSASDPAGREAVAAAEAWIVGADNLGGVSEIIRRDVDHGREELAIEHLTSAWVVRALSGAASPVQGHIRRALDVVWSRYDHATQFWAWGNGDVPAWMVHDAIAALHAAALALQPTPVPQDT